MALIAREAGGVGVNYDVRLPATRSCAVRRAWRAADYEPRRSRRRTW